MSYSAFMATETTQKAILHHDPSTPTKCVSPGVKGHIQNGLPDNKWRNESIMDKKHVNELGCTDEPGEGGHGRKT